MILAARGDLSGARAAVRRGATGGGSGRVRGVRGQLLRPVLAARRQPARAALPAQTGGLRRRPRQLGAGAAGAYALQGDGTRARAYADSARAAFDGQLRVTPENAQLHALLSVALAYLGHKDEAIREGRRGVELGPISRNAFGGTYILHQLVRTYILVGEPEQAIDQLDVLLKIPYFLSPGWLRIDPAFDPLRKLPRFQKLVEGGA